MASLVIDGGLMMQDYRAGQHAADAAATAAAVDLRLGGTDAQAIETAREFVHTANSRPMSDVQISIPPTTGPFAGRPNYVEVETTTPYRSRFSRMFDGILNRDIRNRSVAGLDDVTAGAAIVVLDPNPLETSLPNTDEAINEVPVDPLANEAISELEISQEISLLGLGGVSAGLSERISDTLLETFKETVDTVLAEATAELGLPALPTLTAGLEVEGIRRLRVDGAVLVNTEWGGVDENGDQVGDGGFPYAVACMPILPTTRIAARDIRVVGGVDSEDNYGSFEAGESGPLQANRLPVPDPYLELPAPTVSNSGGLVSSTVHDPGDVVIVSIGPVSLYTQLVDDLLDEALGPLNALVRSLVAPAITPVVESLATAVITPDALTPGVYNSITVISLGEVRFDPGVYIIRGTSPLTQSSLMVLGGWVKADGVLFYITDSADYDATTGMPDAGQDSSASPSNPLLSSKPSVIFAPLLPGSHITGLHDPGGPLDRVLFYQRRLDRRPIVILATKLVGGGDISGSLYSKWGHTLFVGGSGSYDFRMVTGTLRVATVFTTTLAPTQLMPPAQDVLLAE